jgi:predicted DsbA family dithiol-disulfide isomerase
LLQPERPPEGEPRPLREGETEAEMSPAWQERARGAGVVMHRPRWSPNTVSAHEVTIYAKEHGRDSEFHHIAARAYWESGANLGDLEVLKGIAEGCGLNWAELSSRLESGHYRQRVYQEYQVARDKGVRGTPTYMIGGEIKFGDLAMEELREMLQKAMSR